MKAPANLLNILVVEDSPPDLFLIEEMLRGSRLSIKNIFTAERASDACDLLQQVEVNLVILDLSLPDSFGIETLLKIKEVTQKIPVIILTGRSDSEVALESIKQGAQDFLVKGDFNSSLLAKSAEYSIERKKAEEKILASEERYRQMFYKNPFPTWIYDMDTFQILEVNDAAIQKYGYDRNEFLRLTVKDIRPKEDIPGMLASVADNRRPDSIKGKLWLHKKKNGELMLVEVTFYEIDYDNRKAMQAQVNDVTEKIRLEKELAEQQQLRQQQITAAVLKAQEKERKGIGQELHDNINQILAATRLCLDESLRQEDQRIEFVRMGINNITLAIEEIRKLSRALIAPRFTKWGLKETIEDMIGSILKTKKINISLEMDAVDEKGLSDSLKVNLYRIIQEQLNNIIKYAEASDVTISLRTEGDSVLLSVSDNGKGFDPGRRSNGVGITNINSRAGLFNGRVEIDSSPGNGCHLRVVLTMKEQQAA